MNMKAYLISLAAVAAIAALTGLLLPDGGKDTGLRLVTGLCVLAVVASPILEGLRTLTDPETLRTFGGEDRTAEYESLFEENVRESGGAYLAERLSQALAARYSCDTSCFTVRLRFSEDGEAVDAVTVLLSGKAAFLDTYDLEAYVSGLLDCPCTTAIGKDE